MANETNPSKSALSTAQKYLNADIFTTDNPFKSSTPGGIGLKLPDFGTRNVPGVNFGAMPDTSPKVTVNVTNSSGKQMGKDLRVRIRVPSNYLTELTSGLENELVNHRGIIFPYTPNINVEYKSDYSSSNPLHSNFPINFYQKSSFGPISISGKFTVENNKDAAVYLSTIHLLKALTKMRSGGALTGDPDSGSPPPVCRLFGHGEWMFENVPVAITSFRLELPDSVDYFTMTENSKFKTTSVPTVSTISINCLPMYSRAEMLRFNVSGYLSNGSSFNKRGFL